MKTWYHGIGASLGVGIVLVKIFLKKCSAFVIIVFTMSKFRDVKFRDVEIHTDTGTD